MAWYHIPGHDQDVAVVSRVRLSRNLADLPFPSKLDAPRARELITRVGEVLEQNGFTRSDPSELTRPAAYALVERQYVSPAFVRESLPHALFLNEPCNLSVSVCVEDHIRLRSVLPGLALRDGLAGVLGIESLLDRAFPLAFDERLGYLSRSPMELGCGVRASVMLCLPMLEAEGRIEPLTARLAQTGVLLRAICRPGTGGSLYRLTGRPMLGVSEEDSIATPEEAAGRVIEAERRARQALSGTARERVRDRVRRAEAILRSAYLLTATEVPGLLAEARLGAALGMAEEVRVEAVTAALIESMPAGLSSVASDISPADSETARDALRARLVRERLFGAS